MHTNEFFNVLPPYIMYFIIMQYQSSEHLKNVLNVFVVFFYSDYVVSIFFFCNGCTVEPSYTKFILGI